jgi:hypothetical protein
MTSPFQDAVQAASASVDEIYGEQLQISPMVPGRYQGAVPDPDRQIFVVTADFHFAPDRMKILSHALAGRDFDKRVTLADTYATIDCDSLAGREIRAGDIVTRLEQSGLPQFEVSLPEPIGVRRMKLTLVVRESQ